MKQQKQLQPLQDQLSRVKDLTPPDFGTLVQWEKRAIGAIRPNGEVSADLPKTSHAQGLTGTPMPFLGETKVRCLIFCLFLKYASSSCAAILAEVHGLPSSHKV